jgi:hypothetical protein
LRAGGVAALGGTRFSLWSGGMACVAAVGVVCLALPGFTGYDSRRAAAQAGPPPPGLPLGRIGPGTPGMTGWNCSDGDGVS